MDGAATESLQTIVQRLKEKPAPKAAWLPVFQYGRQLAWLEPVNFWDLAQPEKILLLNRWHQAAGPEATRGWLAEQVFRAPDRLLFWVKGLDGTPVGTIGLTHLNDSENRVEVTDLVRGVPDVLPGVMYSATQTLLAWSFQTLGLETVFLQVPGENAAALRLFQRCGFVEVAGAMAGELLSLRVTRANWMGGHRANRAA